MHGQGLKGISVMKKVRFEVEFPGAEKVYIAGTFNNWDPEQRRMKRIKKGKDKFLAVLDLEPGTWEFKYVVDGQWQCCPNATKNTNELGVENSIIEIPAD